jgi:hypothetical protein
MTKDDIIRMARKAGLINDCDGVYFRDQDSFERFAALVAAAEREECAKCVETRARHWDQREVPLHGFARELDVAAEAIRARSQ